MSFAAGPEAPSMTAFALIFLADYACGSIPFGYILSHLGGAGDIRKVGSGNIGATNVLRTGRRGLALLTLLCDAGKGFLPVFLSATLVGGAAPLAAAAGAFLGHLFPVWLRFKGGKGVATYIGIVAALSWPAGIFFCAVWLCVAIVTRYSSLSALIGAALTPVFLFFQASSAIGGLVLALSLLLIARHRQNVAKLLSGREDKIRLSRTPPR
jgi:acyl phosphate:glycerol-3-phosphate acyltransferase